MLLVALGLGPENPSATEPVDVVVVLGCPSEADGSLSFCQTRRILWAHHLYSEGLTEHFIVSGGAVMNAYVEAEAMRQGLVALGVPEEAIRVETNALHTDENLGYSFAIAEAEGFDSVAVASDDSHCDTVCFLLEAWGEDECVVFPADYDIVHAARMEMEPLVVDVEPVEDWLPLEEQEDRAPSWWVYLTAAAREMPQPPTEADAR